MLVAAVLASDFLEGVFVQSVVVAIIAVGRRALRIGSKVGLVLLLEQRVLSGKARFDGAWG